MVVRGLLCNRCQPLMVGERFSSVLDSDDMTDPSDESLAIALQKGDETAFGVIVERFQGRVYSVAYRFTGNHEDALDVTQDALFRVHQKIRSWKPTGAFGGWVMRVASNTAIDHSRKLQRSRNVIVSVEDRVLEQQPAKDSPEFDARVKEIDAKIREKLSVLSPTQSQVFVLRHYEEMSLQEIADALECSVGSVKVHLFRAMRKLRTELADSFEELR
jgi:RNA polymerase sigma-70 factor, ECF subfamily